MHIQYNTFACHVFSKTDHITVLALIIINIEKIFNYNILKIFEAIFSKNINNFLNSEGEIHHVQYNRFTSTE